MGLYQRNGRFYLDYRLAGRRIRKSTGERDRDAAERLLKQPALLEPRRVTIRLYKRGRRFHLDYRLAGKRIRESTGEENREVAERVLMQRATQIWLRTVSVGLPVELIEELRRCMVQLGGPLRLTLDELVADAPLTANSDGGGRGLASPSLVHDAHNSPGGVRLDRSGRD